MVRGIVFCVLSNVLLQFLFCTQVHAQVFFTSEGFEGGIKPKGWTEEFSNGNVMWRYRQGGYNPVDINLTTPPASFDEFRNPSRAYNGTFNAWFFIQGAGIEQTKLITPFVNLVTAVKPTLKFHVTLYPWFSPTSGLNNDVLRVYYRITDKGAWKLLQTYNFPQKTWLDMQINLPDDIKKNNVQLAFEGLSRWGMGVCLDDITIIETGSAQKEAIEATVATTPSEVVPNGTNDNPILAARIKVEGNTGKALLKNLNINLICTDISDIVGVKIYQTLEPEFNKNRLLGATTTISPSITFNSFTSTDTIPAGYSYLWITLDIKPNAKSGHTIDAAFPVNGITVNSKTFSSAIINSPGVRIIRQNLFFDDFETSKPWNLTGDFEIGVAQGLPHDATTSNPDPDSRISGNKSLGNDLTIDGYYPPNIPFSNPYTATSPAFNAQFYKSLSLIYKRWLNVDLFDKAKIEGSYDGGTTWITLWENDSYALDYKWLTQSVTFPESFNRKSNIKIRFSMASDDRDEFTGWNIDDVSVIGNYIENDMAILDILSPVSTCGNTTGSMPISIRVKNAGANVAKNPIPVKVNINGTLYNDAIAQDILPGEEKEITLATSIPLSMYGDNKISIQTLLKDDEDTSNDTLSTGFSISKTYQTPYETNFTSKEDWNTSGNKWLYEIPASAKLNSTRPVWITNNYGYYSNNAISDLISPCIDIVGLEKPMLEMSVNYDTEDKKDGITVYYSTDLGKTWKLLENNNDGFDNLWGWGNLSVLPKTGDLGFSGDSKGWIKINRILPASLQGQTGVKFKIRFSSDGANDVYEGVAINNFTIKEAYDDLGIAAIIAPKEPGTGEDPCSVFTEDEKVTFSVKNFGIKTAKKGTKVNITIKSNYTRGTVSRVEEFNEVFELPKDLAINEKVDFTSGKGINMNRGGFYDIKVKNFDDPYFFYQTLNDSLIKTVDVKKPFVDLGPDVYLLPGEMHNFDISAYASGYTEKWEIKTGNGTWIESPGGGYTRIVQSTDFVAPNNKIAYKATLKDASGCETSSTSNVFLRNPDIQMYKIVTPIDTCSLKATQQFKLRLRNVGRDIDTIRAGELLTVELTVDGNKQTTQYAIPTNIAPTDSLDFIFPASFNMSAIKSYSVQASVKMQHDVNPTNNVLNETIKTFGYPDFVLTPQNQTINGLEYTYDAGTGYKTYRWYDATYLQTNKVIYPGPSNGKIWCVVTDNNGCSTKSEASLTFAIKDLTIKSIDNLTSGCKQEKNIKPALTIENKGNTPIAANTIVPFKVIVNGNVTSENYMLTQELLPNATLSITLNNPIDITATGKYTISIEANLADDAVSENNIKEVIVSTFGLPKSLLKPTLTTRNVEATLDAGPGFTDYFWNTSEITQTILVSKNGKYIVRITDNNGCSNTDTTKVTFIRNELAVDLTSSNYGTNNNVCTGIDEYPVSIKIRNTGNDTLNIGYQIPVTYKLGSNSISEVVTLANKFFPKTSIDYTFTQKVAFTAAGSYSLGAMIQVDDDTLSNNFTKTITIVASQTPKVDLGPDVNSTNASYTINPTVTPDIAGYTYLWNTAEVTKNLTVTNSGTYKLTVNMLGCSASDEITVNFSRILIDSVRLSQPKCFTTGDRTASIYIKNSNPDAVAAGSKIKLSYTLKKADGTTVKSAEEEFTLNNEFAPSAKLTFNLTDKIPSLSVGNYTIDAGIKYPSTLSTPNGVASWAFTISELPVINLPEQINANGSEYTIEGPDGMNSYSWSTGETTKNITVKADGAYTLTVTNSTGCSSSKTVNVTFKADIELKAIKNQSGCKQPAATPITITITNAGVNTLKSGTALAITGTVNGTSFNEQKALTADLAAGASVDIVLSATIPYNVIGTHSATVTAKINGEDKVDNNTQTASITVVDIPTVTLPATINSAKSSEIIVGPEGMTTYEWSQGTTVLATTKDLTVTTDGVYILKVTNANGCSASASTNVLFKRGDIALEGITVSDKLCQNQSGTPLSIKISNKGTSAIASGESITIKGSINGTSFEEKYTLTSSLEPNANITVVSTHTIPAQQVGSSVSINVQVSYEFDGNHTNESASKTVTVVANPTFSVLVETTTDKSQATLKPTKEDLTYLWSNNATTKDITVYENATYKVVGTNTNGCSLTKEVLVDFLVPKSNNFLMVYPAFSNTKCIESNSKPFTVSIVNESQNTTIPQGSSVQVVCSYQITKPDGKTDEYKFDETFKLTTDLAPTNKTVYQFSKMTALGKQTQNIINETAGKQIVKGYTVINSVTGLEKSTQFEIYPLPKVDFGKDTIYRTLPGILKMDLTSDNTFLWSTGETANNILVSAEGEYWVKVTSKNGCVASDTVYVKEGSENSKITLNVYPNPASSKVSVEAFNQNKEDIFIEIYSTNGILMLNKKYEFTNTALLIDLDITGYTPGNYVVVVRTSKQKVSKMLVIGR